MSTYLKVYGWENEKFPWHQRVNIKPEFRIALTTALAKAVGLRGIYARLDMNGGGRAFVKEGLIRLPKPQYRCSLGLIIHEVAHHYDWKTYGGNGHRASFKTSLIKLMVEVRVMRLLPPIFNAIRVEHADAKKRAEQACATAVKRALRTEMSKAVKKTTVYKLQQVQAREKRLRTRIKRLSTALRKAERQERMLARRIESAVPKVEAILL